MDSFEGLADFNFASLFSPAFADEPLSNTIPGDTSTSATIAVNGQVSETLDFSGDQDWFEVTLVAGETYDISMMGTGGNPLSDPLVRIMSDTGVQLATNDDIIFGTVTHSLLTFTAASSGTFYVSAQAFANQSGATSTGDYTLSVTENKDQGIDIPDNDTTTAEAVINGSVSGSIDTSGDVDWFAVTLQAGQRYLISQNATGNLQTPVLDSFLTLFDASGTSLVIDDDSGPTNNSRLSFTPDATGVFYIAADGFGATTGEYGVSIQEVPTLIVRTIDEVAHFLTDEFDTRESYNAGGGGTTSFADLTLTQVGANTEIAHVNGVIMLMGITAGTISASDFTFINALPAPTGVDVTTNLTAGADSFIGDENNDIVNGLAGNDVLRGGIGDDTLNGGDGNDQLFGGLGADVLNGGAGADRVVYSSASTGVTINAIGGRAYTDR